MQLASSLRTVLLHPALALSVWLAVAPSASAQLFGPFGVPRPGEAPADAYTAEERARIELNLAAVAATQGPQKRGLAGPKLFKFYPMAGVWEHDLVVGNWVDLDPTSGIRDWQCLNGTYDGHDAHDVGPGGYAWVWESMDIGWPVFAALDGTVLDAHDGEYDRNTSCSGPANYVILGHGNQRTWYYHLRKGSVAVAVGQEVKAGQQIGLVGSSGCSTGPHLHWRTDFNGAVYESFSGPCQTNASGWQSQLPFTPQTYVYQVAATLDGNPAGAVLLGDRLVGLSFSIANVPANTTYRFRYRRPDNTLATDTGAFALNNSTFYRNSCWLYHWWVNFNVPGTWQVELLVNNSLAVSAPLRVASAQGQITNRPPFLVAAAFEPAHPTTADVVFCQVREPWLVRDPDYNLVRYRYQWAIDGQVVRDVTQVALSDAIPHDLAPPGSTLRCTITPNDGLTNGPATTISVTVSAKAPSMVTQPQSLGVIAGATAVFSASAEGTAPLGYQWRFNGTDLSGATAAELQLSNAQAAQAGEYDVVVTNFLGAMTSAVATLTVTDSAPVIRSQPSSQAVVTGQDTALVVDTLGTDPRSYQWYRNGTAIVGETGSLLALPDIQPAGAGSYSVTISNRLGAVSSSAAQVIVFPADSYQWTTIAGLAAASGTNDGIKSAARFKEPTNVAVDGQHCVYVSDRGNSLIRKLTPSGTNWIVSTLKGTNGASLSYQTSGVAVGTNTMVYATRWDSGHGGILQFAPAGTNWVATTLAGGSLSGVADGTNAAAGFYRPQGLTVDDGTNVFVVDQMGQTLRKVAPVGADWVARTLAGRANVAGTANGTNRTAYFNGPSGVASDSRGNLYVTDQNSATIRKITPVGTNWVVTTIAGSATVSGYADGSNSAARFYQPGGLAIDRADNLYVADLGNQVIRKLTPWGTNWMVRTIGGLGRTAGSADGPGSAARFNAPNGIAVDEEGTLYVADYQNNTIRRGVPPQGPPQIAYHPVNATAAVGSSATFAVVTSGVQPFSYQWQFNGSDIAGATDRTLMITNVQVALAGQYRVVVSNHFGATTSAAAVLSLETPLVSPQPAGPVSPLSATLNGMVVPNGIPTVAWFQWGTDTSYSWSTEPQPLGSGSAVVRTMASIAGLAAGGVYHYRLVASNLIGAVTVSPDRLFTTGLKVTPWGDPSSGNTRVPPGLSNVVAIACGHGHSLALKADGTVTVWGGTHINVGVGPTNVPPGLSNVVAIAGGYAHSLAVQADGTVVAWGQYLDRQPVTVPAGLSNVIAVAGGDYHCVALRADGTVAAWGCSSAYGQTNVPADLTNVVAISSGSSHCLALRANGTVAAWGSTWGYGAPPAGLQGVTAISSEVATCLALKTNGSVVAWGNFGVGQGSVPAGLSNVVAVASGMDQSLALQADGTVVVWGDNNYGQRSLPAGLSNVVAIASGDSHCLALGPNLPPVVQTQTVTGPQGRCFNILLPGSDPNGDPVAFRVASLPATGALYQCAAGAAGVPFVAVDTPVTDPSGRVVFVPAGDDAGAPYAAFNVIANDGMYDSPAGVITINVIPPPSLACAVSNQGSSNRLGLSFSGFSNATYQVWVSTNLSAWSLLGPASQPAPGNFQFFDLQVTNSPQRFYRVRSP